MGTNCYDMVRGSVFRLTRLDDQGRPVESDRSTLVSKRAVSFVIAEVTDTRSGINEKNDRGQRIVFTHDQEQTIGYKVDVNLIGIDPEALSLLGTGVEVVTNASGDFVGVDQLVKSRTPKSFALEIWSRLAKPVDGYQYGYTLFPHLRGGTMAGATIDKGSTISLSIRGAKAIRGGKWVSGPYVIYDPDSIGWDGVSWDTAEWDKDGCGVRMAPDYYRLPKPVSRNLSFHNQLVAVAPSVTNGLVPLYDVVDGGTSSYTSPDVIDNYYSPESTQTPDVLYGG